MMVILVDQVLKAYAYSVSKTLSVYIGLIITNCIVMGRIEAFALGNKPFASLIDGIGNGDSVADYVSYGPNNELYLAPGQAIVDTLGVADEWKTMLDRVTDAAGSASSAMTEEGAAMGTNFAEGISSSMGEVSSAAEQLTAAAEEGASGASGAGAFSAGSSIGAQLAAGLLSQVSYVASASARLGSAASSGLGGGGVRTYGASGGTSGVINTVLNIDGRSFASATSSYMSAALAVRV